MSFSSLDLVSSLVKMKELVGGPHLQLPSKMVEKLISMMGSEEDDLLISNLLALSILKEDHVSRLHSRKIIYEEKIKEMYRDDMS